MCGKCLAHLSFAGRSPHDFQSGQEWKSHHMVVLVLREKTYDVFRVRNVGPVYRAAQTIQDGFEQNIILAKNTAKSLFRCIAFDIEVCSEVNPGQSMQYLRNTFIFPQCEPVVPHHVMPLLPSQQFLGVVFFYSLSLFFLLLSVSTFMAPEFFHKCIQKGAIIGKAFLDDFT